MKRNKKPNNRKIQIAFLLVLLTPLVLFVGVKYFLKNVESAVTTPAVTSLSSTNGSMLGGGSLTINSSSVLLGQYLEISSAVDHACGLGFNGNVYCWGSNTNGQLGNGTYNSSNTPVLVSQGERPTGVAFTTVDSGGSHSCALGTDGNAYCWGSGGYGELGNGATGGSSNTPVLVSQGARPGDVTYVSISSAYRHTCALGSDGNGYCWGQNSYDQLGNGGGADSNIPVLVSQGARIEEVTFSSISAGDYHTCALGSDGNGYCWGLNEWGGLGTGNTDSTNVPALVVQGDREPGVTFSAVTAGNQLTCGLASDNNAYCWGYNGDGGIGNGTNNSSDVPKLVSQGERGPEVRLREINAGYFHVCGIGSDDKGYCWGRNTSGELGNGTLIASNVPKMVVQGERVDGVVWSSIIPGGIDNEGLTCGIGSDGNGYCWGNNNYGQLGNGNTGTGSDVPVAVSTVSQTVEYKIRVLPS